MRHSTETAWKGSTFGNNDDIERITVLALGPRQHPEIKRKYPAGRCNLAQFETLFFRFIAELLVIAPFRTLDQGGNRFLLLYNVPAL
ncbi:MAG: hypothetical protein JWP78_3373 [Mucilaginibacter sp.]|nr:hypothetical protein [Mucilaginibacter sp.]